MVANPVGRAPPIRAMTMERVRLRSKGTAVKFAQRFDHPHQQRRDRRSIGERHRNGAADRRIIGIALDDRDRLPSPQRRSGIGRRGRRLRCGGRPGSDFGTISMTLSDRGRIASVAAPASRI